MSPIEVFITMAMLQSGWAMLSLLHLWLGLKAAAHTLQQAMLTAMGYLPEALPAGAAGPGKRKGAPLSAIAQVLLCLTERRWSC
jgi:hypothetical protein